MKTDRDENSEDRHGMKFTMRTTHSMFFILLGAIGVGFAPYIMAQFARQNFKTFIMN